MLRYHGPRGGGRRRRRRMPFTFTAGSIVRFTKTTSQLHNQFVLIDSHESILRLHITARRYHNPNYAMKEPGKLSLLKSNNRFNPTVWRLWRPSSLVIVCRIGQNARTPAYLACFSRKEGLPKQRSVGGGRRSVLVRACWRKRPRQSYLPLWLFVLVIAW